MGTEVHTQRQKFSTYSCAETNTNQHLKASLTLNLYCVLLFRPCTVQVKFSPVYFGWKSVPCGRYTLSSLCLFQHISPQMYIYISDAINANLCICMKRIEGCVGENSCLYTEHAQPYDVCFCKYACVLQALLLCVSYVHFPKTTLQSIMYSILKFFCCLHVHVLLETFNCFILLFSLLWESVTESTKQRKKVTQNLINVSCLLWWVMDYLAPATFKLMKDTIMRQWCKQYKCFHVICVWYSHCCPPGSLVCIWAGPHLDCPLDAPTPGSPRTPLPWPAAVPEGEQAECPWCKTPPLCWSHWSTKHKHISISFILLFLFKMLKQICRSATTLIPPAGFNVDRTGDSRDKI